MTEDDLRQLELLWKGLANGKTNDQFLVEDAAATILDLCNEIRKLWDSLQRAHEAQDD